NSRIVSPYRSCLFAAYFFSSSAVLFLLSAAIWMCTAPFDRSRKLLHKFACWWGHHYIKLNPKWDCQFIGGDRIDWNQPHIIVANHQSYWDIMVLYGLNVPFKW